MNAMDKPELITLPYQMLNLRINPFGRLTPDERGRLVVPAIEPGKYADRLIKPGFAVQFLGPRGRGKSSHLFALRSFFPDQPYTYIPLDRRLPPVPTATVHFIDELQRLPRTIRAGILERHGSFVIASHKNHAREFQTAGLEFEVIKLGGITPERLLKIIRLRIEWARREPSQPVPYLSGQTAANLIAAFGDDLWAIEEYLYDRFQVLEGIGEVKLDQPPLMRRLSRRLKMIPARFDQVFHPILEETLLLRKFQIKDRPPGPFYI